MGVPFIKDDARAFDMFPKGGMIQCFKDREIDRVGEKEFIKFAHDDEVLVGGEVFAMEREIDVGAVFVVSLGAGTIQDGSFHPRMAGEDAADFLDSGFRQPGG